MRSILWYIYKQPLNRIVLWIVLLIILWAWIKNALKVHIPRLQQIWQIINVSVLVISLFAILYSTLYNRSEGATDLVLIPFQSFKEAKIQPELYRSMLMNAFLFAPLGLTLPNVIEMISKYSKKLKSAYNAALTIVFGFLLSTTIEYFQYRCSLGRCEVDDVIMNTLGTLIGSLSYLIGCITWNFRKRDNKNAE